MRYFRYKNIDKNVNNWLKNNFYDNRHTPNEATKHTIYLIYNFNKPLFF